MRFLTPHCQRSLTMAASGFLLGGNYSPPCVAASLHERIDAALAASPVAIAAPPASDAEFLRRACLAATGSIPTAGDVKFFLADPAPDKRIRLVDKLLGSPQWVRHMTETFDVMLMERRPEKNAKIAPWRQWLWDSFAANKPWDVLVREMLGADGVDEATKPAARWILDREAEPNLLARDTGRIFLGVDMACAQCHNHPRVDDYTQYDYQGLFAFFGRTSLHQPDPKGPAALTEKPDGEVTFTDVLASVPGRTKPHVPGGAEIAEPALTAAEMWVVAPDPKNKNVRPVPRFSRRMQLAPELTSNRKFQKSVANRLWAIVMGRGLVEPLDFSHSENPPAHPALLEMLADEIAALKYDTKAFQRELLLTQAFQRGYDLPHDPAALAGPAGKLPDLQQTARKLEAVYAESESALLQARDEWEAAQIKAGNLEKEWTAAVAAIAPLQKAADAAAAAKIPPADLEAKRNAVAAATGSAANLKAKWEGMRAEAANLMQALSAAALKKQADAVAYKDAARLARDAEAAGKCCGVEGGIAAATARVKETEAECSRLRSAKQKTAEEAAAQAAALPQLQQTLLAENASLQSALALQVEKRMEAILRAVETGSKPSESAQAAAAELAAAEQAAARIATRHRDASSQASSALKQLGDAKTALAATDQLLAGAERRAAAAQAALSQMQADASVVTSTFAEASAESLAFFRQSPLTPEQLCWSFLQATGQTEAQRAAVEAELNKTRPPTEAEKADPVKIAARALEVEAALAKKMQGNIDAFVRLFGGAAGQPQRDFFSTADQALYFQNAGIPRNWCTGPFNDRLQKAPDPGSLADELFLAIFSRPATGEERKDVAGYLAARKPEEKLAAAQDIAWAMLTSAEFRFNH